MNLVPHCSSVLEFSMTFVTEDGTLWGSPSPSTFQSHTGHHVTGDDVLYLISGTNHTVLLTKDGKTFCWKTGSTSELTGTITLVQTDQKFVRAAAGNNFTIALTEDGRVFSWGTSSSNQLGRYTDTGFLLPEEVKIPEEVEHVACGYSHVLVRTKYGNVYGWGNNNQGELGIEDLANAALPKFIPHLTDVAKIYAAGFHSMYLSKNGDLYSWGWNWNNYGNLGVGDCKDRHQPTLILSDVEDAVCGGSHTIAKLKSGEWRVWGSNAWGQSGTDGGNSASPIPFTWPDSQKIASFGAGWHTSFMITERGEGYVWGRAGGGRLGDSISDDKSTPTLLEGLEFRTPWTTGASWIHVYSWIFLGRVCDTSPFSYCPVEVIYHIVGCARSLNS